MNTTVALVGAVSCLVLIVALVAIHLMPTALSPIADPVSAYALTRARAGYALAAVAAAVTGGACALLMTSFPGTRAAVLLLWIFSGARLIIPLFPMDPAGAARTGRGRMHNLLAITAFATVTAAAFVAAGPLAAAGRTGLAAGTTVAAIVMAIGSVGVIAASASPSVRRVFGLVERLIYLGFVGWFALLTITALT